MDLTQRFNKNLDKIEVSMIRQFDQSISDVPGIKKLTLGEPDFTTPDHVKEAAKAAIDANQSHYTGMAGLPALRQAAADFVKEKYNLTYNPDNEILATIGATEALSATLTAILEPGDTILLPAPAYPGYEPIANLVGAEIVEIDTTANDFVLTPEMLKKAILEQGDKLKAVLLNYPTNPTGVTYSRQQIKDLTEVLKKYDIFVVSDEVYEHICFAAHGHSSVLAHPQLRERAVAVSSFGKTYHMTGWKVGYCVASQAISAELRKVHQYLTLSVNTPAQLALADMLRADPAHYRDLPTFYQKKRDVLVDALRDSRLEILPCEGTYFLLIDYSAVSELNDVEFCQWLTKEVGVAAIPLSVFCADPFPHKLIRLCFAKQESTLLAAAERLSSL